MVPGPFSPRKHFLLSMLDFSFLESEEAASILAALDAAQGDILKVKMRHPQLAALAQLWHARRNHADRFALASRMLMTERGAQQATGDAIARYKAGWAWGAKRILVACCGIGGELMALAQALPDADIVAVDSDPDVLACARWNAALVGATRVTFLCARLEDALADLGHFDHCFFDPDRRPGGKRRIALNDYTPRPAEVLPMLCSIADQVHMKVSPMIADPDAPFITWIAEDWQLKECVMHYGGKTYPQAVLVQQGCIYDAWQPEIGPVTGATLLELSPALLRAGLVRDVAESTGAQQLHPASSVLVSASPVRSPFLRSYDILEELPYAPKLLRQRFSGQQLVVKKRFFPLEPAAIRKQLGIREGGDLILFCTTREPQARVAFLCRRRHD